MATYLEEAQALQQALGASAGSVEENLGVNQ